jgi:protease I
LPHQFEEAGYSVVVASKAESAVYPCGGGTREMQVDIALTDVNVEDYDAIVYVGGYGCRSQWNDEEAHLIAREALEHGKVLAAAGCAPTILAHAGLLEGKEAAICEIDAAVKQGENYCEVLESLGAICSKKSIVRDGLIITAGPRSYLFVPGILETIELLDQ